MVMCREEMVMLLKTESLLFVKSRRSPVSPQNSDNSVEIIPIFNTKAINELSEVSKPQWQFHTRTCILSRKSCFKQTFSFARLIQKERHILTADIGTSPWRKVLIFFKLYFKIDINTLIYVCAWMHVYIRVCVCVYVNKRDSMPTHTPRYKSEDNLHIFDIHNEFTKL